MTTPSTDAMESPTPVAKPAPLWEDFIDIFHAPSEVYARRENSNPWPMILIITVLVTLITVFTWGSLAGPIEAETREQMAKAMAKNPQATADAIDSGIKMQMGIRRWSGVFFPVGVLIASLFVWLLAKVLGAKETYQKAMIVVTYSAIIAVVQMLVVGAQALVIDTSALTTPDKLSLSAARFADKATTSPIMYSVLKLLDVFGIWSLIVMCIGVRVTGKTSKNTAIMFGVIWFAASVLIAAAFAARTAAAAG
ncbi:MAG: YIP1 family protein [Gemmatimonadaceae bacterium]